MEKKYFFDVNGNIGCGCRGYGEFPHVQDLISHMDYLNIARAAVWSIEARDVNPSRGNKKLAHLIDNNINFKERLIPSFIISPPMFYERDAIQFIREYFKLNKGVLRISPHFCRHSLSTIERILKELQIFSPVLFWNFTDTDNRILDSQALTDLAIRYPNCTFIITHTAWGAFSGLLDLMWRAPNILTDISFFHMRGAIKIVCSDFGAGRVVFGTGHKTNYGAAAAGLAFADIRDEEKSLIAHGNIEKLLGLSPLNIEISSDKKRLREKPLWNTFSQGQSLNHVEILDAHCHSGPATCGWVISETESEITAAIIAQAEKIGVSRMFVSHFPALFGDPLAGNRESADELGGQKIFKGYFVYNPHYHNNLSSAVLESLFKNPFFIGFKLLPAYWGVEVRDKRFQTVWEFAEKYRLPILIHTWEDNFNRPAMLEGITKKYKNAFFLLGHSGGGDIGRRESVDLAKKRKNVYLEFCGTFGSTTDWMETITEVGSEHVIFGSDAGMHDQAWELGRLLSIPLPDEIIRPILGLNFLKILEKSKLKYIGNSE